jgi:hypothetical protein
LIVGNGRFRGRNGTFRGQKGTFRRQNGTFRGQNGTFRGGWEVGFGVSEVGFQKSGVGIGKTGVGLWAYRGGFVGTPGWVRGHTGVGSWAHQGGFVGIPGEVSQTDLSNGLQKTLRQTSANTVNVMPFGAPADYQPLVFQEAAWSGDESSPKPRERRVVAAPWGVTRSGIETAGCRHSLCRTG